MKRFLNLAAIALAVAATIGCSVENPTPQEELKIPKGLYAIVDNPVSFDGDDATKAINTSMGFEWTGLEKIDVFTATAGEKMIYRVKSYDNNAKSCVFSIVNFGLLDGTYYAMIPTQGQEDDPVSIPVSIIGQKQSANNNTAHLTAFDYNTATSNVVNNQGGFAFSHRVCWAICEVVLPEACTAKSLTLISGDNAFVTEGTLNVVTGELTPTAYSSSVTVDLDDIEVAAGGTLKVYVTLFSVSSPELSFAVDAEIGGDPVRFTNTCKKNLQGMPVGRYATRTATLVRDGIVARIGDTQYSSLDAAFAAVEDGQTVTLLRNVELTEYLNVIDKNFTLDLAGYSIVENSGYLILKNTSLTIKSSADGGVIRQIGSGYAVVVHNGSNLVLESGYLISATAMVVQVGTSVSGDFSSSLTVTGGGIISEIRATYRSALAIYSTPYVTLTLNISDTSAGSPYICGGINIGGTGNYNITGGTFSDNDVPAASGYVYRPSSETKTIEGVVCTFNYKVVEGDVAQIGTTGYATLDAAFAAVEDGQTVTLLKNTELPESLSLNNKNFTLDLAGYSISENGYCLQLKNTSLTIKSSVEGGVIRQTGVYYAMRVLDDSNLILESGYLISNNRNWPTISVSAATAKHHDPSITVTGGGVINKDSRGSAIYSYSSYMELTLNISDTSAGSPYICGEIFIASADNCIITGGTFSQNVARLASGYHFQPFGETKTIDGDEYTLNYRVVEGDVAQINTTGYATLEAAFAAVQDGQIIELLCDYSLSSNVSTDKTAALDLGGYTLTSVSNTQNIKQNDASGTLTVRNGTVTTSNQNTYAIYLCDGLLCLENVTVTNTVSPSQVSSTYTPLRVDGGRAIIRSDATVIGGAFQGAVYISGGTVNLFGTLRAYNDLSSHYNSVVAYVCKNGETEAVFNVLSGARIIGDDANGKTGGIYANHATVNIESGSEIRITSMGVMVTQGAALNISGGLISNTSNNGLILMASTNLDTPVSITGGYLYANQYTFTNWGQGYSQLSITGGRFRFNVSSYLTSTSDTYECVADELTYGDYTFNYKVQGKYGGNGSAGNYDNGDDNTNGGIVL